jgi:hypothetical protein
MKDYIKIFSHLSMGEKYQFSCKKAPISNSGTKTTAKQSKHSLWLLSLLPATLPSFMGSSSFLPSTRPIKLGRIECLASIRQWRQQSQQNIENR